MYAAEALVLMDKINEALDHLNPEHIKNISFDFPLDDSSSNEEALLKTNPPPSKSVCAKTSVSVINFM